MARARQAHLAELQEQESAVTGKLDDEAVEGTAETGDYIPLDDETPRKKDKKSKKSKKSQDEEAVEDKPAKKEKKKDKKRKRDLDTDDSPAEVAADKELPAKKKSKKDKKDKKQKQEIGTEGAPADAPAEDEPPAKKSKKTKKRDLEQELPDAAADVPAPAAVPADEVALKKAKKDKKSKKEKKAAAESGDKDKAGKDTTDAEKKPAAEAANWNVGELEGGASRQAKFLRLLGGKSAGGAAGAAAPATSGAARQHFNVNQVTGELEKQFEAGRRMKHDMGGQRRGLGA